ncbi:MAG TPA: SPOR domain-containing protein, partial [Pseudoxanthomonas sp.]|nr:SPOR domain-containing protein [Pseudoxanthomonas sp.]
AQRIGTAGFDDYLVVNSGDQLNGIALGRYGSREAAERRQSALAAAGFAAQLQAIGQEGAAQWWLDVEAPADIGPQLKALAGSAQSRPLDCATLR